MAAQQCQALRIVPDTLETKEENKKKENVDVFNSGPSNDNTEAIVLICFHNWLNNNKQLKISNDYTGPLAYKFRDI